MHLPCEIAKLAPKEPLNQRGDKDAFDDDADDGFSGSEPGLKGVDDLHPSRCPVIMKDTASLLMTEQE